MTTRRASTIAPFRTSGVQPHVAAGAAPAAAVRRAPAANVLSPRQQRRIAALSAALVDPTIEGDDAAIVTHVGSARIALPSGARVSPGVRGVMYVLMGSRLHVLVESAGRVRELVVDDRLSARLRAEHFGV